MYYKVFFFYFKEIFQSGSLLNWIGRISLIIWPHYLIWKPNVKHFMMRNIFQLFFLVHHKKKIKTVYGKTENANVFIVIALFHIHVLTNQYNIFNLVKHCLRCLLRCSMPFQYLLFYYSTKIFADRCVDRARSSDSTKKDG